MKWVWQLENWPKFEFLQTNLENTMPSFLENVGRVYGAILHLNQEENEHLKVEFLCQEVISTSLIEGEILNRDSVQSSIRKHLGLHTDNRKIPPKENDVAEMYVNMYLNFDKPLSDQILFNWHAMLMNGRRGLFNIGSYRTHEEPMQIISGNYNNSKVFYEAPPSKNVPQEMKNYIKWFNHHAKCINDMPTLIFASIAHLYFEMIHPFEDGNGRIGRAMTEKALSMRLKSPSLNSISKIINKDKSKYYNSIMNCNHQMNIEKYLDYFSNVILEAQQYSFEVVSFTIKKNKFFNKYQSLINERQKKALLRIFEEGFEGFTGGLSANNYRSIVGSTQATTTRDLQSLTEMGAFYKTGEYKGSRYYLNLEGL